MKESEKDLKNIQKVSQIISPFLLKIYQPFIDNLFNKYKDDQNKPRLNAFLFKEIAAKIEMVGHLKNKLESAEQKLINSASISDKRQIMLEFCSELGASEDDLKEDKEAFNRWFDFEAITERALEKLSKLQNEIYFIFLLLTNDQDFLKAQDSSITQLLLQFYNNTSLNDKIRAIIVKTLSLRVKNNSDFKESNLNDLKFYLNLENDNLSIEELELNIEYANILSLINPQVFLDHFKIIYTSSNKRSIHSEIIFKEKFQKKIFLKRALIPLLLNLEADLRESLINLVINDQSSYVRQGLVDLNDDKILANLIFNDPDKKVQAKALLTAKNKLLMSPIDFEGLSALLVRVIAESKKPLIVRLVLEIIEETVMQIGDPKLQKKSIENFNLLINKIITEEYPPICKNLALEVSSVIWLVTNGYKKTFVALNDLVQNSELGEVTYIHDEAINELSLEIFGRIIAIVAKNNFDLQFAYKDGSYYVIKGIKKGFRLWRFLHEIFSANPDKRQNFSHTTGRIYSENNIAVSSMSELSKTQVPGEPLFITEEQSHRPFLPLLDYYLYALNKGKEANVYSAFGITTIFPPSSFLARIYTSLAIALKFRDIANLRNWQEGNYGEKNSYIKKLEEIGVSSNFKSYEKELKNEQNSGYFLNLAVFSLFTNCRLFDYFLTPHEETLAPLFLFIILIAILGIWYHKVYFKRQRKDRNKIPLVIGGWGTRGKTGTERLKCAMLGILGEKIVSKTTGCEPAIVVADSTGKAYEMPIIRPYKHATINEQLSITHFARNYGAKVLLWECMALRDEYVKIMQNEWMIDDLSTITNAHPDHEDVQGPSGWDVADTIASFIRPSGHVITSEQQMLPILQESAKLKCAKLEAVDWHELYTDDLLAQFPYYEHEANLALVNKLAKTLGIDENTAFATMSARVIPDIGALKAFMPCTLQNKTLQFINGMSANEELGCLNNWQRLGFKNFDQAQNPGVIISTIVNNRADRGSRSKTFANLIARRLAASYHFLIGTNLSGMKTYIEKSWREYLKNIFVDIKQPDLLIKIKHICKDLHICMDENDRTARTNIIKNGVVSDSNKQSAENDKFINRINEDFAIYSKLIEQVQSNQISLVEIKDVLTRLFTRKIIIIDLKDSNADDMIKIILDHTPPNYLHKLVGIQNIKNPGLDFVRAWRQWETCLLKVEELGAKNKKIAIAALQTIAQFDGFSLLSKEYVKNAIINIKDPEIIKNANLYLEEIARDMNKKFGNWQGYKSASKWNILGGIYREIKDIIQSIHNKKLSLKIYEDLAKKRISYAKASKELAKLNID